jgi:hypothetical protein
MNKLILPSEQKLKTDDTAIVITTYCEEPDKQLKLHMTKKLAQSMIKSNHVVVIASHSCLPVDIQEQCDLYVYDNDNLPHVNGIPKKATKPFTKWDPKTGCMNSYYGIAELKSMHNAINALKKYPHVKNILKICYDSSPAVNHLSIIQKSKLTKKKLVTPQLRDNWEWVGVKSALGVYPTGNLGTHAFWVDIEFLQKTLSLDEVYRYDTDPVPWLECVWYNSVKEKKLLNEVYLAESYMNFMGETIHQFNDSSNDNGPYAFAY